MMLFGELVVRFFFEILCTSLAFSHHFFLPHPTRLPMIVGAFLYYAFTYCLSSYLSLSFGMEAGRQHSSTRACVF